MTISAGARPVLLIDDADADRDMLCRAFRKVDPNREVVACPDGATAQRELRQRVGSDRFPSFVIVDINMPRQNGLDLLVDLRSIAPTLPVLVMSGSARGDDVEQAYARGAAGFFEKPLGLGALAELLGTIDTYWSSAAARPGLLSHEAMR